MAPHRLTLHQLFLVYPGGIGALIAASGVPRTSLYRVATAEHDRCPVKSLAPIAAALGVKLERLVEAWHREHAKRLRAGRKA